MRSYFTAAAVIFLSLEFVVAIPVGPPPETTAAAVVVLDARTGKQLHGVNAFERRPVASTQKLLTALLVIEGGLLDGELEVEDADTRVIPTKVGLRTGLSFSRRALLDALLIRSGNDVAMALGRDQFGSLDVFVARMNQRAWSLGMFDSLFLNPSGLPHAEQFSTAADMARLAMACYREPLIRQIVAYREADFEFPDGRVSRLVNSNRVLHGWEYCNGMKTGYTRASGHCLISSAAAHGRESIVVVLGGNRESVWQESYLLLAWSLGFQVATE